MTDEKLVLSLVKNIRQVGISDVAAALQIALEYHLATGQQVEHDRLSRCWSIALSLV